MPEGELYLVSGAGPDVIGARIDVRALSTFTRALGSAGVPARGRRECRRETVWVPPAIAHGIWLALRQKPTASLKQP
jgi:hypothetical protein